MIDLAARTAIAETLPQILYIDVTNRCNSLCMFTSRV